MDAMGGFSPFLREWNTIFAFLDGIHIGKSASLRRDDNEILVHTERQQGFGECRPIAIGLIRGQGNSGENAEDCYHDHEFDQSKTPIVLLCEASASHDSKHYSNTTSWELLVT